MGYGSYVLPDGREAGYNVAAECDYSGCKQGIDRGLGYLCGGEPDGFRDPDEGGCGFYFCDTHICQTDHSCTNPDCGKYSWVDEGNMCCYLAKGHDLPHVDHYTGNTFTDTEYGSGS